MTDETCEAVNEDEFHTRLEACIEAINALLPGLSERYSVPEILSAFVEHVAAAFLALRQKKIFDEAQTVKMIEMIEKSAFRWQVG